MWRGSPDLNVIAAVGVGLGVITQNMKVVIANADAQLSALISQATGDLGNLINQVKSLEGNVSNCIFFVERASRR
jgi:hypothetical protein